MNIVSEYEFIENKKGELALLVDVLAFGDAVEPVLLVSRLENKAYLQRSPGDIHEIGDINGQVIDQLRGKEIVHVVEVTGSSITHSYEALAGLLEEDYGEAQLPPTNPPGIPEG